MRIRNKVLAFSLPLTLASAALMTSVSRRAIKNVLLNEVYKRGVAMAIAAGRPPSAVADLATPRPAAIALRLELALKSGALYATAVDTRGFAIAATDPEVSGRVLSDGNTAPALASGKPRFVERIWNGMPVVDVSLPIWSEDNRRIATIFVGLPISETLATARTISHRIFLIIIGVSGLALSVILYAIGLILEPIGRLAEGARNIGKRRLGESIPVSSSDEIGDLTRTFNHMSFDLAQTTISREYLDNIVQSVSESLIVLGLGGEVRRLNRSAASLLAYSEQQLSGKRLDTVLPGLALRGLDFGDKHFRPVSNREALARTRLGEDVPVLLSISALSGEGGRWEGYIVAMRDMRARKQAQQLLELKSQALERTNRELADFTTIASHDLREPLRKILVFGDRLKTLAGERLEEPARQCVQRMQDAARRMERLIDDLLKLSRITSVREEPRSVDLNSLLDEVVNDLETRVAETNARIEIGPLPTIEGDRSQLQQLFQNLLGNAIKFAKRGEPPRIQVETGRQDESWVEITVSDSGIGFDDRYASRIFQAFQRLHSRAEYEGTGIGLAICAKIVERHGGSISAHGVPGVGAVFLVKLPRRQATSAAGPAGGSGEPARLD